MAVAQNKVISGDFAGWKVGKNETKGYLPSLHFTNKKQITTLYKRGLIKYEILDKEESKNSGDALLGGILFGTVGAIVGSSVINKIYTIRVQFKNVNIENCPVINSVIEIDDEIYQPFKKLIY